MVVTENKTQESSATIKTFMIVLFDGRERIVKYIRVVRKFIETITHFVKRRFQ